MHFGSLPGLLQEGEQCDAELKIFCFPHFWMTLKKTIKSSQPSSGLQDIALMDFAAQMPNYSVSNEEVSFNH